MSNLLKPSEIKKEFGYSRQSLLDWEEQGRIAPLRTPGGHRRYRREDLAALTGEVVKAQQAQLTARDNFREFGTTGLRQWSGSIHEERFRELTGREGRRLYREMRLNDPVISAVFFTLVNALKQPSWRVSPASNSSADKEAAEFVESCLDDMSWSWSDQLTFAIEPTMEQGFSLLEVIYKKRLGDKPTKYTDNPAQSKFNDGRIGWRKLAPRPAESLAAGSEWRFDEAGGIQGINQHPEVGFGKQVKTVFIPIEKLLHFRTTTHPANNPEGVPIHRAMYIPYYYTKNIQEIEGIGIERDLAGIPVVYLGSGTTLTGANSDYQLAKDLVTNIRMDEQTGVVIPHPKMGAGAPEGTGFLLELLSASGSRNYNTSEILDRYDKRKAVSMLAQFIMLGMSQVGSYALSKHQGDIFILAASSFLHNIADVFNRHGIPRLMRLNAFPGITGMPKLVPSSLGIPDLKMISDYVNGLVEKELLTPDDELERHLRQIAELPEIPEGRRKVRKRSFEKQTKFINDVTLALQRLNRFDIVSDSEAVRALKPIAEDMKETLRDQGIEFDEQAEGQTEMPSPQKLGQVGNTLSQAHERDIKSGVLSVRIARQQLLQAGQLSQAQFNELELNDGRLPDGSDVLILFDSPDEFMEDLLDLNVPAPTSILDNDAEDILIEISVAIQDAQGMLLTEEDTEKLVKIKLALAALSRLQGEYEQVLAEEIAQELQQEQSEQQPAQRQPEPEPTE